MTADGLGLPHIGPREQLCRKCRTQTKAPCGCPSSPSLPTSLSLSLRLPSSSPPSPLSFSFPLHPASPPPLFARFSLALMRRYRLSSGGGWVSHCGFLQKLLFHPGIKFPAYLNTTLCLLLLPPALEGAAVRTLAVCQLCARIAARPACPHPGVSIMSPSRAASLSAIAASQPEQELIFSPPGSVVVGFQKKKKTV